ncbi:MAG: Glyoxalase/bleomycin resistance protein/dioxygenase [Acidimicrobiaceae bacterium]|nr:Glyoxalase/bleomycin resistance protein/dioxygenase [Acidimicrobiaceae bacterium]
MRESRDVFHLAVPAYDLDDTVAFYVAQLGCKLARRYDDRVTLDFFGDQLVCHLSPAPEEAVPLSELPMYPRHFGVTFREQADFDALYQLCQQRDVNFHSDVNLRFEGRVEVHRTFVICDPSSNLLEFKYYFDHRMMY